MFKVGSIYESSLINSSGIPLWKVQAISEKEVMLLEQCKCSDLNCSYRIGKVLSQYDVNDANFILIKSKHIKSNKPAWF